MIANEHTRQNGTTGTLSAALSRVIGTVTHLPGQASEQVEWGEREGDRVYVIEREARPTRSLGSGSLHSTLSCSLGVIRTVPRVAIKATKPATASAPAEAITTADQANVAKETAARRYVQCAPRRVR